MSVPTPDGEGEYIYRLVEQEAHVQGKKRLRVWIDSQTEEEILHGIATAKIFPHTIILQVPLICVQKRII